MFDLIVIMCRYLFVFYLLYFLLQGVRFIMNEREIRSYSAGLAVSKQRITIIFMHLTAFLILAYKPGTFTFDIETLIIGTGGLIFLIGGHVASDKIYKNSCPLMWNGIFFLMDVGLIMLERLDHNAAKRQLIWFLVSFIIMLVIPLVFKFIPRFEKLEKLYLIAGFILLILPSLFGIRRYGAVNWITLGNFNFQPSELVKFLFIFYLASVLRKKLVLKQLVFPSAVSALFIFVLVFQRDLGGALIFFMTFLTMLYISTGSVLLFLGGISALSGASVIAYNLFGHIQNRIAAWMYPMDYIDNVGYQTIQALFAIGSWGIWGSGLTRGLPQTIPVVESDMIFSAICEEFGSVFGIFLIGVFMMIFYRGINVALRCTRRYYALLSAGFTGMLAFQTFLIIGGNIKLLPLTGVTLPFVSYGGSSVLVSIMMVGILQWVFINGNKTAER